MRLAIVQFRCAPGLVLAAIAMLACDGGSSEASSPTMETSSPVDPAATEADTAESQVEPVQAGEPSAPTAPPAPTAPDPRTEEGAARLRAFDSALRAGRRSAHNGRQDDAIEAFERALESADDPRARCELGWALYRAGRLEDAARNLDHALHGLRDESLPDRRRATYGACLYNRGRVAVAAGDSVAAARAYRRSLALRPNDIVQRALDELGEVVVPDTECVQICEGPHPTRDALRDALQAAFVAHHVNVEFYCSERGSGLRWDSQQSATAAPPFEELYISAFSHGYCVVAAERSIAVVEAKLESGWSGCGVLEAIGGVNDSVHLRYQDVLTVRGTELAARPRIYNYETELAQMCMGCDDEDCDDVCDYETFTSYETVLVVRDGRLAPRSTACLEL